MPLRHSKANVMLGAVNNSGATEPLPRLKSCRDAVDSIIVHGSFRADKPVRRVPSAVAVEVLGHPVEVLLTQRHRAPEFTAVHRNNSAKCVRMKVLLASGTVPKKPVAMVSNGANAKAFATKVTARPLPSSTYHLAGRSLDTEGRRRNGAESAKTPPCLMWPYHEGA